MNDTWKKRTRVAFRVFEVILAVALLAVLLELLLVMLNAPGPVPEIRILRSAQALEEMPAVVLAPAELPPAPVQAVAAPAVPPPAPRRSGPPVLLDFENLRRLLGATKTSPGNNVPGGGGGGNGAPSGGAGSSPGYPLPVFSPVLIPATNAPPAPNATPVTNDTPVAERPPETNQTSVASSNTNTNNDSPVFRFSVP